MRTLRASAHIGKRRRDGGRVGVLCTYVCLVSRTERVANARGSDEVGGDGDGLAKTRGFSDMAGTTVTL